MDERERIRVCIKKYRLTYVWLINQLALRDIITDKAEMSAVISGNRSGIKADAIIKKSIEILDLYGQGSVLVKRDGI